MLKITIYTLICTWIAAMVVDTYSYVSFAWVLSALDVITGTLAARKRGEKIQGKRMMDSIRKCFYYTAAILLTYQMEEVIVKDSPFILVRSIPFMYTVGSYIILKEFKSNIENISELTGVRLSGPISKLISLFFFYHKQTKNQVTMADVAVTNLESKEMAEWLGILGTGIYQSQVDGKLDLSDFGAFTVALLKAPQAFTGAGQIPQEVRLWKTRPELKDGVVAVFKNNLQFGAEAAITEDAIETVVDAGIELAIAFAKLFGKKETEEVEVAA